MKIKEDVLNFFEENFMVEFEDGFNNEAPLLENGIIDSTGVLELVEFLNEKFNINIEDDEIIPENLDSLNKIEKFVKSKLS